MQDHSPDARQTPGTPAAWADPPTPPDPVMDMLGAHLPLSLIMDLVMPAGPHSRDLLVAEPGDTSWLDRP